MNSFFECVRKMSPAALRMVFYGTKSAFWVLLIGFLAYKYNQRMSGDFESSFLCIELIKAGFSLLVQFIIGGIILDCAVKKK